MNNEIHYVDFMYSNKIRPVGSWCNYTLTEDYKKIIFTVRRMVELTGERVEMRCSDFCKVCEVSQDKLHGLVSNLSAQKLIIMESPSTIEKESKVVFYGTPDLILTTRVGNEFEISSLFSDKTPKAILDKYTKNNTYYIYLCKNGDAVVYVGKGTGDRINHCLSGKSSSSELNQLVSDGVQLTVHKVAENLTEEMAFYLENAYITSLIKSGVVLVNKKITQEAREYLEEQEVKPIF